MRVVQSIAPDFVLAESAAGDAVVYVAVDGRFGGTLTLADRPRAESTSVVEWMRAHGVERVAMLTGDAESTARSGCDADRHQRGARRTAAGRESPPRAGELRPRPVMMVGDGVNDAPVLAAADVGVAMGARGATAAGDAAVVVVLVDSLDAIVRAMSICWHTLRVALTAIWIGIALSVGLMLVATTGVIPAAAGALLQEAVDVATILYALRALAVPRALIGAHAAGSPAADRRTTAASPQ